jgi:hypothetical protein
VRHTFRNGRHDSPFRGWGPPEEDDTDREIQNTRALYSDTITCGDAWFGDFLDWLEKARRLEYTTSSSPPIMAPELLDLQSAPDRERDLFRDHTEIAWRRKGRFTRLCQEEASGPLEYEARYACCSSKRRSASE